MLLLMAEIRRSPVDMVNIPLFTRFYTSQVVQDFFHQQYLRLMEGMLILHGTIWPMKPAMECCKKRPGKTHEGCGLQC